MYARIAGTLVVSAGQVRSFPVPFKISAPAGRHEASEVTQHRLAHPGIEKKISASVFFPSGFLSFQPAMLRCGLTDRTGEARKAGDDDDGAPSHRRRRRALVKREAYVRSGRLVAAGGSDTNVT